MKMLSNKLDDADKLSVEHNNTSGSMTPSVKQSAMYSNDCIHTGCCKSSDNRQPKKPSNQYNHSIYRTTNHWMQAICPDSLLAALEATKLRHPQ